MNPEAETPKRGRGRPRKHPIPDPTAPKRPRGRPRKQLAESEVATVEVAPEPAVVVVESSVIDAVSVAEEPTVSVETSSDIAELEPAPSRPVRKNYRRSLRRLQARGSVMLDAVRARLKLPKQLDKFSSWQLALGGILVIVVVAFAGTQLHSWLQPTVAAQNAKIITDLSRVTDVPTGETPRVLKVIDQSRINQPFLQDAKNGDVVVIYDKGNKAYLFRPSTRKVISAGPLSRPIATATTPTTTSNQSALKIGFYNGGAPAGATAKYEPRVTATLAGSSIVIRERAARQNYPGITIIDLNGQNPDAALRLASQLGGKVGNFPEGETKPQADILIIFGVGTK